MFQLFGNTSVMNATVAWQAEPTNRGTWSILSSCIITTSLCVWTAVHLNLPRPGTFMGPSLTKFGWVILGLAAPELIVFTAWFQYRRAGIAARAVSRSWDGAERAIRDRDRRKEQPEFPRPQQVPPEVALAHDLEFGWSGEDAVPSGIQRPLRTLRITESETIASNRRFGFRESGSTTHQDKWRTTHGFFVAMGGLAIDTYGARRQFLPDTNNRPYFLDIDGVAAVATVHPELLDPVTTAEILDKSKSNGIAKAVVCVQAVWFLSQCISRLARALPITLLELNTFGHYICVLLIYLFWWSKPFDIIAPLMLRGEVAHEMLAWMWMHVYNAEGVKDATPETEIVDYIKDDNGRVSWRTDSDALQHGKLGQSFEEDREPCYEAGMILMPGEQFLDTGLYYFGPRNSPEPPRPLHLSAVDIERWKLASRIFQLQDEIGRPCATRDCISLRPPSNWPSTTSADHWLIWLILILAGAAYGFLHALAWNAPFRTRAEQVLWQISALLVTGFGILMAVTYRVIRSLIVLTHRIHRGGGNYPGHVYSLNISRISKWSYIKRDLGVRKQVLCGNSGQGGVKYHSDMVLMDLMRLICGLATLLYAAARMFLVIECFLSLFHSPPGVFRQPVWSVYFPHLR